MTRCAYGLLPACLLLFGPFVSATAQVSTVGGGSTARQIQPRRTAKPLGRARPKRRRDAAGELTQAYKREFAFLEAEKRSIKGRIARLQQQASAKLVRAKAELDGLHALVTSRSLEADRLQDLLLDTERKVEGLEDKSDVVDNLLHQAQSRLDTAKISLPEAESSDAKAKLAQVDFAFRETVRLLARVSSVRSEPGMFFLPDGKKVEGTLLRLGNVATYGISPEASGALAPAGEGRLKLWSQPAADVAQQLAQGHRPPVLKTFLYESLAKEIEEKREKALLQIVDSGGVVGWVIVALGALGVLFSLVRAVLLARSVANTSRLVRRIRPLVLRGQIEHAIEVCRTGRSAPSRVLKRTLENLHREREQLEDVISESILHEQAHLDRFGALILVIAAVAPLLGLLGTVTGMISTFDVITEFGTGDPKLLSGGISQALVTTQLGLIVAIPTLLAGSILSGWAESIKDDLDHSALQVTNLAAGRGGSDDDNVGEHRSPSDGASLTDLRPGPVGAV